MVMTVIKLRVLSFILLLILLVDADESNGYGCAMRGVCGQVSFLYIPCKGITDICGCRKETFIKTASITDLQCLSTDHTKQHMWNCVLDSSKVVITL